MKIKINKKNLQAVKFQNSFVTIQKMTWFLGKNYSNEEINNLVEFTSFKNMKKKSIVQCGHKRSSQFKFEN